MAKTNAVRIVESNKISYSLAEYTYNEEELDAVSVANAVGAEPECVFKTLVTVGDKNGYNVFCIPANTELNLKKAALISANKKIEMIKVKELLDITGYIRGGCSPVGMKKLFPTYIDETAQLYNNIYVSAGIRGMQICLNPNDLKNLIIAQYVDIT